CSAERNLLLDLGRACVRLSMSLSACLSRACACARHTAAARAFRSGSEEGAKPASASAGRSAAYFLSLLSHSSVCSANIMIRCLRKSSEFGSEPGGGRTFNPDAPASFWKGSWRYSRISALFQRLGGGSRSWGDF